MALGRCRARRRSRRPAPPCPQPDPLIQVLWEMGVVAPPFRVVESPAEAWARKAGPSPARTLAKKLEEAGRPRPGAPRGPPHRPGARPARTEPIEIAQGLGLHPNQAENGAWLPGPKAKRKDPPAVGTPHRPIHTDAYYRRVADDLADASNKQDAERILRRIGQRMERGAYP